MFRVPEDEGVVSETSVLTRATRYKVPEDIISEQCLHGETRIHMLQACALNVAQFSLLGNITNIEYSPFNLACILKESLCDIHSLFVPVFPNGLSTFQ
jgi:hypothetical protein